MPLHQRALASNICNTFIFLCKKYQAITQLTCVIFSEKHLASFPELYYFWILGILQFILIWTSVILRYVCVCVCVCVGVCVCDVLVEVKGCPCPWVLVFTFQNAWDMMLSLSFYLFVCFTTVLWMWSNWASECLGTLLTLQPISL